jgi:hypothetical protein
MIDAATISRRLAECKRVGMLWPDAWRQSVGIVPPGPRNGRDEEMTAARFFYLQCEAHYLGEDSTVNALSPELSDEDYSVTSRGRNRTPRGDAR